MDAFRLGRGRRVDEPDLERQQTHQEAAAPGQTAGQRQSSRRPPLVGILRHFSPRPASPAQPRLRTARQPSPSDRSSSDDDTASPKTPVLELGTRTNEPTRPPTDTAAARSQRDRPAIAGRRSRRRARVRTDAADGEPEIIPSPTRERAPAMSDAPAQTTAEMAEVTQPVPAQMDRHRHHHHHHNHSHSHGQSHGQRRDSQRRRFRGADPAELHLVDLAEDGRRRSHQGRDQHGCKKRFLCCFPYVKSQQMRSHITRALVSALVVSVLLAVCLALAVTHNIGSNEFAVLLILLILMATIFMCHSLVRICMLVARPPTEEEEERHRRRHNRFRGPGDVFDSGGDTVYAPGGYAIPRQPIRVVLARDEEAIGIESVAAKVQPPAYGLWRESVRVDPNRIYWQRNEDRPPTARPATGHARPPSYASDDGVTYVVEAQPRSTAPATDAQLPQHPAEAGRVAQPPAW